MKISIITATLNSCRFLEECICSVLAQRPADFEHIVVDGGSIDETITLAKRYPHLTIVEHPGCSIYQAWNIGLDVASGDLIGVCNSDDFYASKTFERAIQEAASHPDAWLVGGKAIQFTKDNAGNNVFVAEYAGKHGRELCFEDLNLFGPSLNARFLTRKLVNRFGKFDTRFRLGSDCSYMMEIALNRLPAIYVDEIFYYYRSHSSSSSLGGNTSNATISLDEKLRIGSEFIASGRLQAQERRHLRHAIAMQFVSTIVECANRHKWSGVIKSARSFRWFSFSEGWVIAAKSCSLTCSLILKRARQRLAAAANRANRGYK